MNRTAIRIRNNGNLNRSLGKYTVALVMVIVIAALSNIAVGMPGYGSPKSNNGPWEVFVQMGLEGQGLSFPIKVDDPNKPQKLSSTLPILGTPIKIKLAQYLPDLKWDTIAAEDPNGGIVVKLAFRGQGLEQDTWLSSNVPTKQSVSSRVGGVKLKKLNNAGNIEKLLREIIGSNAIGIVTIWPDDNVPPTELVVNKSDTIAVPKSKYKVKVLDFLPHYSIDSKTKKIINRSDKPLNPAIKVSVSDGENTYEQWLWSKFPTFPHSDQKHALRIEFTHFDLNITSGKYILVAARAAEPWLFLAKEGKTQLEKAILGRPYPFSNKDYSFTIEKIFDSAVIKNEWKKDSGKLGSPAIIATIEQNGIEQEVILELHKPLHHKTMSETMVLVYRPAAGNSQTSN